jgi:arginine-tRNA-protein transferase
MEHSVVTSAGEDQQLTKIMSFISLYGLLSDRQCGYCKSNSSAMYAFQCTAIQPEDYQDLMDRGWSRSGSFFYKPDAELTCCKLPNIRLDVSAFRPSQRQTKVLKMFEAYLSGEAKEITRRKRSCKGEVAPALWELCAEAVKAICNELGLEYSAALVSVTRNNQSRRTKYGEYTLTSAHKLTALCKRSGIEVLVNEVSTRLAAHLEECEPSITDTGLINLRYDADCIVESAAAPPVPEVHCYSLAMEVDSFTEEKFELYARYQKAIHNDSNSTPKGFKASYCNGPLSTTALNGLEMGGFHFTHRIDGRLVAFALVGITPSGLTSAYFIYDPDLRFLSLGIVGALKEIEFVRERQSESFKFYYMGYYLHSSPKMKYKAEYAPSELLCLETYRWVPYSACLPDVSHNWTRLVNCLSPGFDRSVHPDMDIPPADLDALVQSMQVSLDGELCSISQDLALRRIVTYLSELVVRVGRSLATKLVVAF